jgi:hypothetical protein
MLKSSDCHIEVHATVKEPLSLSFFSVLSKLVRNYNFFLKLWRMQHYSMSSARVLRAFFFVYTHV